MNQKKFFEGCRWVKRFTIFVDFINKTGILLWGPQFVIGLERFNSKKSLDLMSSPNHTAFIPHSVKNELYKWVRLSLLCSLIVSW